MIQFAIIIAIILVITLYFLLLPILRNRNTAAYERNEQNIHFAQERLQELEIQLKNASISKTDFEALKQEIEQTLADDLEQKPKHAANNQFSKTTAIFIITFVPIVACSIYLLIGKPDAIGYQQQIDKFKNPQDITNMLETIETRLQQHPDDEKGWSVLGNSYMALGEFQQATRAYRQLLQLKGNDAQTLVLLADAIAMANNGNILGEPEQLIRKALALNPNHAQTLWLAGMAALQNGQPNKAKTYWQKLIPMFADMPAQQQELLALIEQANTMQNTDNAGNTGSATNTDSVDTIENKKPTAEKTITVQVSIDETLQQEIQPNNLVFIFAKAQPGANAPRAPLAVKRLTVADLPTQISLSDADAMMPQLTISKFDNIIVSARISKSGNPIAQTGDLQSENIDVNGDSMIKLIINRQVP